MITSYFSLITLLNIKIIFIFFKYVTILKHFEYSYNCDVNPKKKNNGYINIYGFDLWNVARFSTVRVDKCYASYFLLLYE